MPNHLEKLTACECISEWATPWDERLMKVTGLKAPIDAKSLREDWSIKMSETTQLVAAVGRLIVPPALYDTLKPVFNANSFGPGQTSGIVTFDGESKNDFEQCFPFSEKTLVFDRHGIRGNAAVAFCGGVIGLAVICMEYYEDGGTDLMVQPVKPDKFAEILAP